ncbi:MAG: biopolymer transporter ExbD [Saprospiraceae bacterium]|jgi:biopolymer transport protein ExbD|nr:biopolymer transporter ExbD [Saprospiraceae bacterium]
MHKKKNRRLDVSVNAGSMADIAFLLLIFFLVTTTILSDSGILVKLPPWEEAFEPPKINNKNVFTVKINAKDQLLAEGDIISIDGLKDRTKEFILNKDESKGSTHPKKRIISLQNDRSTSYDTYMGVYNELKEAYNELWEDLSQKNFNAPYHQLAIAQQKTIRNEIPMIISEAEPTEH